VFPWIFFRYLQAVPAKGMQPFDLPMKYWTRTILKELSTVLLSGIAGLSLLFTLEKIENHVTDRQLLP